MKTILIPTDFSNNALMAVDFAINQLMEKETKIFLVNVYQVPHGGTSGLFYLLDQMQNQAKEDMESFRKNIEQRFSNKNLNIETKISQGDFAEQCNITAADVKADCIVMGTKGASGVKEVLIGSNTVKLLQSLERPLYVIPEDYREKDIEEVIICYDGQSFADKVVPPIRYYTDKHQLPLKVLHVRIEDESPVQDWSEMKKFFKDIKLSFQESHGKNFEEGLKKGIDKAKAILVLVRHKQSFWERFFNKSDSRKAVMHAELPILVIPE